MSLPAHEAERWRLVEQRLRQYEVDIDRLWRAINQDSVGGRGMDGGLSPEELAALTGAGSGSGVETVPVYHIAVRGAAVGGTISWSVGIPGVSGSSVNGTFNHDDDEVDCAAALSSFDPGVQCQGGTLLWNVNRIKFSDPRTMFYAYDHDLVREDYSSQPKVEYYRCEEPALRWE